MSTTIEDRQIRRRLAILRHAEEVTGNVAMTCRYYGISRQCSYVWKLRYGELGPDGLKDRSHRPKTSPNATHVEVVGKILYFRQNYHFAPAKISMYLARDHDVSISRSGVWRILKRLELNRLPASQRYERLDRRWQRYEKQLPGHQVQIDVKFIAPIGGDRRRKHYQFTAIDDCTRLRVLRIYPRPNQKTAIQFADYVLEKLPFQVQEIQTDNGPEFGSSFHHHLLDKGVGHRYIKPRTPRLNGKVERSHRIDTEEFYRLLDGALIDDAQVFNNKLQEWEDYYKLPPTPRQPRRPDPLRRTGHLASRGVRCPARSRSTAMRRSPFVTSGPSCFSRLPAAGRERCSSTRVAHRRSLHGRRIRPPTLIWRMGTPKTGDRLEQRLEQAEEVAM